MAANEQVHISRATVVVNGVSTLGGPNEVTIEGLKAKTVESMSLGNFGTLEFAVGIEKMGMSLKLNHINGPIMGHFGDIFGPKQVQVRSLYAENGPSGITYKAQVYKLTATSKTPLSGISLKAQEKADFEIEMSISEITLEIENVEIFHFSAITNAYRVNGVSVISTANSILGI